MIEMEMSKFLPAMHLREAAQKGETILLTRFGKPVAEVKPLPAILERPESLPPPGSMPGADQIEIDDDAFPSWVLLTQDEYEELKGKKE
jgi:hypothetical protein